MIRFVFIFLFLISVAKAEDNCVYQTQQVIENGKVWEVSKLGNYGVYGNFRKSLKGGK